MATIRIQVRRGTASQWTSVNPTLEAGEMGLETDTNKIKFGTGSTAWTALGYLSVGDIPEIAMDAINTALSLGSGLTKSYNDATDTIGISLDTAVVATLSGTQTLTNKTLTSPVINTPTGITKSDVGLANVDNTSDASKPISTATQTALDLKASNSALASHEADTTTIHGIANTALLATMDYVDSAVGALSSSVDTDFIPVGDRGTLNGVAPLNASVKIDNVYLTSDVVLKDETQTLTNKSLTSPALTGTPTAPTAAAGTNTTQVATTAYTVAAINSLIDGAPGTLNTLNEIAAAINDDASYAAAISAELTAKAPLASPSFSGTVSLPPTTSIGSVNGTTISYLDGVTSAIQTQINAKAPLDSPTFTGTVVGIGKSMIGLANVDNTTDAGKPVSTATQAALNLKAPLASPTFTGTVVLPDSTVSTAMIADSAITSGKIADGTIVNADISGTAAISTSKIDGLDNTLSSKAPTASPVFTGTVVLPATTSIGDVSAEELQSISTVVSNVQTQISSKADATNASIAGATFTGTVVLPSTTSIADVSATEISYLNNVTGNIQTQLNNLGTADSTHAALTTSVHGIADTSLLATTANVATAKSEAITAAGTAADTKVSNAVAALTKSSVGLANVDNTSDANKPISTATQTALDLKETVANVALKAPLASPALTGVPTAPTAAAATNTTQVATTAYVRGEVAALVNSAGATLDTLGEIATALGNDANLSTTLTTSIGLKAPIASPTFTGTVTIPEGASISGFAPLASPTFTGTNNVAALTASGLITASASGVAFTDGTQTKEGIASRTPIIQKTASYTLSALTERDNLIEVSSASATTITIPADQVLNFPIGTSIDILQTGAGQVTIAPANAFVTVNATPGLKLRTTWSSATLFKRAANTWVVFGDLTA
jgi:hypothetical protein